MERVILTLDAGMLDHAPGVGLQTAHRTPDVSVYLDDFLDAGSLEEGGGDALFYTEYHAVCRRYLWEVLGGEYLKCRGGNARLLRLSRA